MEYYEYIITAEESALVGAPQLRAACLSLFKQAYKQNPGWLISRLDYGQSSGPIELLFGIWLSQAECRIVKKINLNCIGTVKWGIASKDGAYAIKFAVHLLSGVQQIFVLWIK